MFIVCPMSEQYEPYYFLSFSRKSSFTSEESARKTKKKLHRPKAPITDELGDLTDLNIFTRGSLSVVGRITLVNGGDENDVETVASNQALEAQGGRDQPPTLPSAHTTTLTPPSSDSPTSPIKTSDPLRDSKGRRISRERIESRWAKIGAVNRADIRPEDDPGTLAGESSSSDDDEQENGKGGKRGGKKKKSFLKVGLNIFGRKKKKKPKPENDGVQRHQSGVSAIGAFTSIGTSSTSDDAVQAPLAQPEETGTPEHRANASSAPSNAVIAASMSDSQMMVTDFGANLILDGSSPLEPGPSFTQPQQSSTLPIDINRPDETIELMDSNDNNNVPYDQLTDEEQRDKIAKVVEKLESIASKISNSATPVVEGCSSFADADALSTSSAFSSSAYNPLSVLTNMLNRFYSGAGSAGSSASSTTASNLVLLADLPLDRHTTTTSPAETSKDPPPDEDPSTNLEPVLMFSIDEEERQLSPESGVDVLSPTDGAVSDVDAELGNGSVVVAPEGQPPATSADAVGASASNAAESAVASTSEASGSRRSTTRRPSVPMTLNLDLNVPADRERLYQPILRELLGPACGFTDFSRIASTILRPHNRAGQLAKFFEITSNALLMTGSQRDQERLKEWAMKYFEDNLAPYIVEGGWDRVLNEDDDEGKAGSSRMDVNGGGGGGGETETSRDSELD